MLWIAALLAIVALWIVGRMVWAYISRRALECGQSEIDADYDPLRRD